MRSVLRLVLPAAVISILAAAVVAGALFFKVIPVLKSERAERIRSLPRFLVLSNGQSILRRDLASLQGNLDAIVRSGGGDLLYVYFLDARGEVLAVAYSKDIAEQDRSEIEMALKNLGRYRARETSRSAQIERLEAVTGAPAAVDAGGSFQPIAEERITEGIDAGTDGGMRFTDVAIPMTASGRAFGGVRAGFRDDLADRIRGLQVGTAAFCLLLFLVTTGGAWALGAGMSDEAAEILQGRIVSERRRLEEDFAKRLRSVEARQEEDSPLSATEFFALLDTAKRLQQSLDYNEILSLAVQATLQTLDVRDMSLFLLDSERNELYGRAGFDESGEIHAEEMSRIRIPVGQGDIGLAAEFGTTAVIDNPKPGSAVVAALVARGKVLGVILARNKASGRPMLKKDALILRQLSALVAGSLENAALYHQALLTGSAGGGHTGLTAN